jgi:hypothetical protein
VAARGRAGQALPTWHRAESLTGGSFDSGLAASYLIVGKVCTYNLNLNLKIEPGWIANCLLAVDCYFGFGFVAGHCNLAPVVKYYFENYFVNNSGDYLQGWRK